MMEAITKAIRLLILQMHAEIELPSIHDGTCEHADELLAAADCITTQPEVLSLCPVIRVSEIFVWAVCYPLAIFGVYQLANNDIEDITCSIFLLLALHPKHLRKFDAIQFQRCLLHNVHRCAEIKSLEFRHL